MRIPHTISKNVFQTYRCSIEATQLPCEQGRSIRAEDETWDELEVPELRILALGVLVQRWQSSPIVDGLPTAVDRDVLLEMLPNDLPFHLVIERISDEDYWRRAAKYRWEYNNPTAHGNSWRRLYCERHFAEYLEAMENTELQKNKCESLIKLVQPYIQTLRIRSLIPSKYPFKWSGDDDEDQCSVEDFPVHHIPFNVILPQLTDIQEIHLNFGMIYLNDGFEWRDFEFSVEDCLSLGNAIKNSGKMEKIAITKSNLNQARVAALLHGIVVNNNISQLDLSHCKLADGGAHAIGEFLTLHRRLQVLRLTNNQIGPRGIAGIVYGLLQNSSTPLRHLELRLNPLRDEGGSHVCALLLRNGTLETLNISGCCLTQETGLKIADVISSGHMKISSLNLNVSNNNFGTLAGQAFSAAMKSSGLVVDLDVRMCNFSKDSEYFINESIARNKKELKSRSQSRSRRSSLSIPWRVQSLVPPKGFEEFQTRHPEPNLHDIHHDPISSGNDKEALSEENSGVSGVYQKEQNK